MDLERQYARDLVEHYETQGWQLLDTRDVVPDLGFEPDLVFKRASENLVVEIKKEGVGTSRAVHSIREMVEARPGWRFELKFVPPDLTPQIETIGERWLLDRLAVACDLQRSGRYPEAFLIAWTATEAVLRRKVDHENTGREDSIPAILRAAYESATISDKELRRLGKALQIRNRIAHGYDIGDVAEECRSLIELAERIIGRDEP